MTSKEIKLKIESLLSSPIESNQKIGELIGELYGLSKDEIEKWILTPWDIKLKYICETLENYSCKDESLPEIKDANEKIKQRIIREALFVD